MGYGVPDFIAAYHLLSEVNETSRGVWIFPNPFITDFHLYFDIPVNEILFIDVLGKVVWVEKVDMQAFELKKLQPEGLIPGIYLIVGQNRSEYRTSRLIKQ